ncbi:MAG: SpoIIE family protein phosphatase [Proteobacteria bacterium]|nr:SpoIIE family protein phosphatase [Pseudomonadota bacterium]
MGQVEHHLILDPMTGLLEECGDTGVVVVDGESCFAALVDVLGHGPEARQSAIVAEEFLPGCAGEGLTQSLRGLHDKLRRGRGAVVTLLDLDLESGELLVAGIGNITTRIFGAEHTRVLSRDGIVGYSMSTPREQRFRLRSGDVVLLYSDGIRESFEAHDCPGLLAGSAKEIAERVMRSFRKGDDDASCLVLRYNK